MASNNEIQRNIPEALPLMWRTEQAYRVLNRARPKPETEQQFAFAVALPAASRDPSAGEEPGWAAYVWEPEGSHQAEKPARVGVATMARRLIAQEQQNVRHSRPFGRAMSFSQRKGHRWPERNTGAKPGSR